MCWVTHSQVSYFHLYSTEAAKSNYEHLGFLRARVGLDFLKHVPMGLVSQTLYLSAIRPWLIER